MPLPSSHVQSADADAPDVSTLWIKPITEAVHGEKVPRLAGCRFDFLPQLNHQLIQRPRGAVVLDAPHFGENGFARHGVAAFAAEDGEDLEFAGREYEAFLAATAGARA